MPSKADYGRKDSNLGGAGGGANPAKMVWAKRGRDDKKKHKQTTKTMWKTIKRDEGKKLKGGKIKRRNTDMENCPN